MKTFVLVLLAALVVAGCATGRGGSVSRDDRYSLYLNEKELRPSPATLLTAADVSPRPRGITACMCDAERARWDEPVPERYRKRLRYRLEAHEWDLVRFKDGNATILVGFTGEVCTNAFDRILVTGHTVTALTITPIDDWPKDAYEFASACLANGRGPTEVSVRVNASSPHELRDGAVAGFRLPEQVREAALRPTIVRSRPASAGPDDAE